MKDKREMEWKMAKCVQIRNKYRQDGVPVYGEENGTLQVFSLIYSL
jgi:hypothetical protein